MIPLDRAELFATIGSMGVRVGTAASPHPGAAAYYPTLDAIGFHCPIISDRVLAHELGHATGHLNRCNRSSLRRYQDSGTALRCEEAIAEAIAFALIGPQVLDRQPYPTVTPRSRAAHYVTVCAREALALIRATMED